jgi:O-antigen ligase
MVLVIGMPLSKFMMSIAQIIMAANWILEGNWKNKFNSFYKNKPALVLSSLLLLHFLGLIYTSNFHDAYLDIKVKFPLFTLPLILSTSRPLSEISVNTILQLFVGSILGCTIFSTLLLYGVVHRHIIDARGISIFISHIRFGLLICVAIFISGMFISKANSNLKKLGWGIIIVWFIIFLILMESMTGLSILIITTFILFIYRLFKLQNSSIKYSLLTLMAGLVVISCFFFIKLKNDIVNKTEVVDFNKLEHFTSLGNKYQHGINTALSENGHLIWIYFCDKELKEVWQQRSTFDYEGKDGKGNPLKFTLVRFLTSKALRKDAKGLNSLTDEEIKSIEKGIPNVNYQGISSLKARIYETLWEIDLYNRTGDANGHSLTQRLEYWKTALHIIKSNLIFGVGTGDVQDSFDKQYEIDNSSLQKEWRLHSHNQYLSITVAFGLVGLVWFLFTLIFPVIKNKANLDYLYMAFFIIATTSFLTEDTLETQDGVTFYGFLNSFLLFVRTKTKDYLPSTSL